jgi:hypothetical protein
MELADRIEELIDGHKAAEGGADVWRHVQAKEVSPFAAPRPEDAVYGTVEREQVPARVSSLVGADLAQFGRPAEDEHPSAESPEPPAASSSDDQRDGGEDISRWAPPERR